MRKRGGGAGYGGGAAALVMLAAAILVLAGPGGAGGGQWLPAPALEGKPLAVFEDSFEDGAATSAKWWFFTPGVKRLQAGGSWLLQVRGADDPTNTNSESAVAADSGKAYLVDGFTLKTDVFVSSFSQGYCGLFWGFDGSDKDHCVLALRPSEGAVGIQVASGDQEGAMAPVAGLAFDTWYRVELVSTATTYEVWLAERGQALAKVLEVAHTAVDQNHSAEQAGLVGMFADNDPFSLGRFDNVYLQGTPDSARRLACPVSRAVREQPVRVPLWLNDASGVSSLTCELYYDSVVTGLGPLGVQKGALISGDPAWTVTSNLVAPGHLHLSAQHGSGQGLPAGSHGEIADVWLTVVQTGELPMEGRLDLQGVGLAGPGGSITVAPGDGMVRVVPPAQWLAFDYVSSPQYAGQPFTLGMTGIDEYGETATLYGGTAYVGDATGSLTPNTAAFGAGRFVGEVAVGTVTVSDQITAVDATYPSITGQGNLFQVLAPTLAAPTNLLATAVGWNQVNLTWSDNSASESGFEIERKAGSSGTFAQIGTAAANAIAYSDTTCQGSTRYYYRVRSYQGTSNSGYSSEAEALTPARNYTFDDVPPSMSIWPYVEAVVREGITSGCSTNPPRYCPDRAITRGQLAVFLCRAMGLEPRYKDTPSFQDVPKTNSQYPYIEALVAARVTSGCSADPPLFCPTAAVTRGQMAVFVCRATGLAPYQRETPTFEDVPKTSSQYAYIEALVLAGITSGCSTNPPRFCPTAAVTRGQMAVFVCRAFEISTAP